MAVAGGWSSAWTNDEAAAERVADEVSGLGWTYVSRLVRERRPTELVDHLARLGGADLTFLRRLRFAASDQAADVALRVGPAILPRLRQSTRAQREVAREARGRIDWPATMRERWARGGDPTILAVSRASRHADLPENRALAFLLDRVAEAADAASLKPGGALAAGRSAVAKVGAAARELRASSILSGIQAPLRLSAEERQAVRVSRLAEMRNEVTALLALHDDIFVEGELDGLRRVLGDRIWLPPEADKVFELWVLFLAARSLEADGWTVKQMSLLGAGGGRAAFVMRRGEEEVRLAFQTLPRAFLEVSAYTRLLEAHGIGTGPRRPDVLATTGKGAGQRHLIIEVKLTSNRDYITDSIYKVLGYIADFRSALLASPNPKAALVVWSGITVPTSPGLDDEVIVLDAEAVRQGRIATLLAELSTVPRPL